MTSEPIGRGAAPARVAFFVLFFVLGDTTMRLPASAAPLLSYTITAQHAHDPTAFTQGLLLHGGWLYESTGLYGRSSLRRVDPKTGRIERRLSLAPQLFGEGLALVEDRLVQLTWRAGTGFVYERESFRVLRRFSYRGEGWGLTYDGRRLIMSDGSDSLRFLDADEFGEIGRVQIRDGGRAVTNINELEFASGAHIARVIARVMAIVPASGGTQRSGRFEQPDSALVPTTAISAGLLRKSVAGAGVVFANVWQTDRVLLIDPDSGSVLAELDFNGLLSPRERASADVLNGLAYDPATGSLWVTGKLWPKIFQIQLGAGVLR